MPADVRAASVWPLIARFRRAKYRKLQEQIADDVSLDVARAWRDVRFQDLDRSIIPFLDRTFPKVEKAHSRSAEAGVDLYVRLRAVAEFLDDNSAASPAPELVELARPARSGPVDMSKIQHLLRPLPERDTLLGLAAESLGRVKRAMPAPEDDAMARGMRGAMGVAVTRALSGGRDVITDLGDEDPLAYGWQRQTDLDPCYFCALLAANGPFYKREDSFAKSDRSFNPNLAFEATGEPDGIAKVHDNCRCTLIPVFEGGEFDDVWGKVALDLWDKVTEDGHSARRALNEYRRRYNQYKSGLSNFDSTMNQDVNATQVLNEIEATLRLLPASSDTARFLRSQMSSL